jgi:Outer membrane protein
LKLDESMQQFNQSLLTAVQETDNAVNSYRKSIQQIVAMREVCKHGRRNAEALPRFVQIRAYSLPERTERTSLAPDIRITNWCRHHAGPCCF